MLSNIFYQSIFSSQIFSHSPSVLFIGHHFLKKLVVYFRFGRCHFVSLVPNNKLLNFYKKEIKKNKLGLNGLRNQ